jgi:hypothetical protein
MFMDFEGGAEPNGCQYGLTDLPLPFYEGMRGYLSSEGDTESLAIPGDSEDHLPQHRISSDSAALMSSSSLDRLLSLAVSETGSKTFSLSANLAGRRFLLSSKALESR